MPRRKLRRDDLVLASRAKQRRRANCHIATVRLQPRRGRRCERSRPAGGTRSVRALRTGHWDRAGLAAEASRAAEGRAAGPARARPAAARPRHPGEPVLRFDRRASFPQGHEDQGRRRRKAVREPQRACQENCRASPLSSCTAPPGPRKPAPENTPACRRPLRGRCSFSARLFASTAFCSDGSNGTSEQQRSGTPQAPN